MAKRTQVQDSAKQPRGHGTRGQGARRTGRAVNRAAKSGRVRLKVILHPEEEGGFSVAVPALPGCYTRGDTVEEAIANAREAAEGWLEAGNDRPWEESGPNDVFTEIEL